jgi:hypothetical protein
MQQSSSSPPRSDAQSSPGKETSVVTQLPPGTKLKKFHNGWTRQLENLVAEWADKAACYQWMHQKTESKYQRLNMIFTIPVIIMSTLTGTANFATDSIVESPNDKKYITFGIGAISLIAGIISTVSNFLRYAQGSEAHRVAAIAWGKFQRFISIELALHPNERMDAMSFLKMGRVELDRLIEQSPPIPTEIVQAFMIAFRDKKDVVRPEIADGVEHARVFDDRDARLARVAADAAMMIQKKKGLLRELVMEDIDRRIVSRTKDERLDMEHVLRAEMVSAMTETARDVARDVARETASTTVKSQAASVLVRNNAAAAAGTANPREEVARVIPAGVVERTQAKLAEAAAAAAAARIAGSAAAATSSSRSTSRAPSRPPSRPTSPPRSPTLRIEIVEDDAPTPIDLGKK